MRGHGAYHLNTRPEDGEELVVLSKMMAAARPEAGRVYMLRVSAPEAAQPRVHWEVLRRKIRSEYLRR